MMEVGDALNFNEIKGPELVEVKTYPNFGDAEFWTSLNLD
jgi:hypothetical protein